MTIHPDNPFSVPVEQRDPVRRLRGRLTAPVTVLTAGEDPRTGITVSSLFVVEGDPPRVASLVGTGSDFVDAIEESGKFVTHILSASDRVMAETFAGLRPSPGGMFASFETDPTSWGPKLTTISDWAGCRLEEIRPLGDQLLVVGEIEELEVSELTEPLVYFRGAYHRLEQ